MRTFAVAVAIAAATIALQAQGSKDLQTDQAKIKQGATVYVREKCARCHWLAGKGGNPSHPLDGVGTKLNATEVRAVLVDPQAARGDRKPATGMPSSAKLSKTDLDALVAYVFSLKALDIPR
jgi:mono/diheme cytochrome c family protein